MLHVGGFIVGFIVVGDHVVSYAKPPERGGGRSAVAMRLQRTSRPRRSRFRQSSVVDETHMRGAPPPAATTGRTFSPCPYYLTTVYA